MARVGWAMRWVVLVGVVVLGASFGCVREAGVAAGPVVPPGLSGDVRYLFEAHCGECHLPAAMDERAPRTALSVFDLDDAVFTLGLSDARLVEARRRFEEANVGAEAMGVIDRWLQAEWVHRDGRPEVYPVELRQRPADDPVVTPRGGCLGAACMAGRG